MTITQIQKRTGLQKKSIEAVLDLLQEGATVPFIARYRKERTGSLDEVQITEIQQVLDQLVKLDKRKKSILKAIEDQKKLTPGLAEKIQDCWELSELEDLYLPFKKLRKTKADLARENGLEGLAKIISAQKTRQLSQDARRFIRGDIHSIEEALEGARFIIAEWANENLSVRQKVRRMFQRHGVLHSKVITKKKSEADKYAIYFDYAESLNRIPSHRVLAIYRGVAEGLLRMKIAIDENKAFDRIANSYIRSHGACAEQIELALKDDLKRLILPSIENEFKKLAKEKADVEAIDIFAANLRQLLLAPPLGSNSVIAFDPGFRTGCKVAVVDGTGKLPQASNYSDYGSLGYYQILGNASPTDLSIFALVDSVALDEA